MLTIEVDPSVPHDAALRSQMERANEILRDELKEARDLAVHGRWHLEQTSPDRSGLLLDITHNGAGVIDSPYPSEVLADSQRLRSHLRTQIWGFTNVVTDDVLRRLKIISQELHELTAGAGV